jgi:hypothetical protein
VFFTAAPFFAALPFFVLRKKCALIFSERVIELSIRTDNFFGSEEDWQN